MAMPAGNEAAGIVVAAGEGAEHLMGKRIACVPGSAYGTYAYAEAAMSMPVEASAEQAASSFVNPMTALGFTETMKVEGYTGIVHAAAASNLGQMLVKICLEDSIPLVNIVRSDEQVKLLKDLGATHVLNMTDADFMPKLIDAIAETKAMIGFDPIGGWENRWPDFDRDGSRCQPRRRLQPLWFIRAQEGLHLRRSISGERSSTARSA